MAPWVVPALETFGLLTGAIGFFILAGASASVHVELRKTRPELYWVQSPHFSWASGYYREWC